MTKLFRYRLYVTGETAENYQMIQSVEKFLNQLCRGRVDLSIIDILKNPVKQDEDHIWATPTLLRLAPEPAVRMLGDFTDYRIMKRLLKLP